MEILKNFVKAACSTESRDFKAIAKRFVANKYRTVRLVHGAIGVVTEAGEIADALKKHLFYGKPLDETNLIEEIGDVMYYLAVLSDALGVDLEECLGRNMEKLAIRYGGKFSKTKAIKRDLKSELKALKGKKTAKKKKVR